jgi:hypothetical protein
MRQASWVQAQGGGAKGRSQAVGSVAKSAATTAAQHGQRHNYVPFTGELSAPDAGYSRLNPKIWLLLTAAELVAIVEVGCRISIVTSSPWSDARSRRSLLSVRCAVSQPCTTLKRSGAVGARLDYVSWYAMRLKSGCWTGIVLVVMMTVRRSR